MRSSRAGLFVLMLTLLGSCGRPVPEAKAQSRSPSHAPSSNARHAELDPAAEAFFAGPIRRFEITVPRKLAASLRDEPRKYVPVSVTVGTNHFENVGLHLKGAAGSRRDFDDKPALTLNFDKFQPGQHCFGLDKLHLNNSVQDDSYLNEIVASELYRRSGVPTARATHALVTLNGRDLGLYVLKEGYDRLFLHRNFPASTNAPGNLYDGGFLRDVDQELERDEGNGPDDYRDLRALVAAAREPLSRRQTHLEAVLDVDRFLSFLAGQTLTDDWDGYGRNRNNYRVYFEPNSGRAVFLPHGMDQLFRETGSTINPDWSGLVADRVMDVPEFRRRYQERLASMVTNAFTMAVLSNQLHAVTGRLHDAFSSLSPARVQELEHAQRSQTQRIFRRVNSVERQLGLRVSPTAPTGPLPPPSGWDPRPRSGRAEFDVVEDKPGEPALHIVAQGRGTVASFRTSVWLTPGNYVFSGRVRVQGIKAGDGAGLRISGAQRGAGLTGDRDWTPVRFEFRVEEERDVELVAELGASAGEVWFDARSLAVTRR